MHLCYLTNEYPKPGQSHGGIGSFLKVICPALVRAGNQVSIINGTSGQRKIVQQDGVTIIYTPFSRKKGFAWWYNYSAVDKEIAELHKNSPIDVVEGSEMSFAFTKKINDIVYIIRMHGGHHFFAEGEQRKLNKWKAFQEKRSFKIADGFIGVSHYVVNHTKKLLQIGDRPTRVIMIPIDLNLFSGADFKFSKAFNLIFVGTLVEKKGIRQLILALEKVISKFPEVKLQVYGRDWVDSKGNSYLKKLKENIPQILEKHVVFHGSVDQKDLPEIYKEAHLCIFPSHIETLGLVAPEAMAMQRAVLYSKTGPGPEVIEDGKSGWLCDPHDPVDIAGKIIEILSDDHELKKRATTGMLKVRNQFNLDLILDQNIAFYREVIDKKAQ